ncbi:hypothetical protein BBJ28_00001000 [Nothophytophthora sp. Chile5]|nr:hypothetical protein BBJ28_00001000 [Nothophytophthora sp. Chile5]
MGAGPSLAKFLKSMDDDDLKVFALAKMRYFEVADPVDATAALSMPASLLPPGPVASSPLPPALGEMLPAVASSAAPPTATAMETIAGAADDPALNGVKDPMNALWSFEGHRLRELQPADKNPQNHQQQQQQQQQQFLQDQSQPAASEASKEGLEGAGSATAAPFPALATPVGARELDSDGHPVLYGSCGRDKRYARCSVCYFRGLRCNSAHYCACCQRPVCIRPRKYPGEEHPKICWNVLHMDKDMIQRVEKKKKRKRQALTAAASAAASGMGIAAPPVRNVGPPPSGGDEHSGIVGDDVDAANAELQRTQSIPTVVVDVNGAVNL